MYIKQRICPNNIPWYKLHFEISLFELSSRLFYFYHFSMSERNNAYRAMTYISRMIEDRKNTLVAFSSVSK